MGRRVTTIHPQSPTRPPSSTRSPKSRSQRDQEHPTKRKSCEPCSRVRAVTPPRCVPPVNCLTLARLKSAACVSRLSSRSSPDGQVREILARLLDEVREHRVVVCERATRDRRVSPERAVPTPGPPTPPRSTSLQNPIRMTSRRPWTLQTCDTVSWVRENDGVR